MNLSNETKAVVLIVDDNPSNLRVIAELLEKDNYQTVLATDSAQMFEFLEDELPDIILLDVMLPGMDGFEACKKLQEHPVLKDIPVIFITAKSEPEDLAVGFDSGAVDYISKPIKAVELKARIKNHLELKETRDSLMAANETLNRLLDIQKRSNELITKQNDELLDLNVQLKDMAVKDPLTGLYNRRFATEKLLEEIGRFNRFKRSFAVIMCDFDGFRHVNDTHGHSFGDLVLQNAARIMLTRKRTVDTIARWGGEEFIILLPETDLEGAHITAERIRKEVGDHAYAITGKPLHVTMTFGIAMCNSVLKMEDLIRHADDALLYGKRTGKDRVIIYDEIKHLLV